MLLVIILSEFKRIIQPLPPLEIIRKSQDFLLISGKMEIKAWFPPMRLTYSEVYSYENKYNLIGGNALNNLKKNDLTIFHEIIHLFSQE